MVPGAPGSATASSSLPPPRKLRLGVPILLLVIGGMVLHWLTRDGLSFDDLIVRGRQHAAIGRFPQAIESFTAAIARRPEDPEVHRLRASARMNIANFEDALSDLDLALRLDPHYAQAYYDRAISLYQLERDPEMVCRDLNRACALDHPRACAQIRNAGCPARTYPLERRGHSA